MYSIFKSRTVWVAIVMWVVTNAPVIGAILPPAWKGLLDAVLTLLVIYFHTNPSQTYNPVAPN